MTSPQLIRDVGPKNWRKLLKRQELTIWQLAELSFLVAGNRKYTLLDVEQRAQKLVDAANSGKLQVAPS